LISKQARKVAIEIVTRASQHMALEDQALSSDNIRSEIERITNDLSRELPNFFWDS
jgi:hypothetical protein